MRMRCAAGASLTATLQWAVEQSQDSEAEEVELQLVSPADPLDRRRCRRRWPGRGRASRARTTTHRLSVPEDASQRAVLCGAARVRRPGASADEVRAVNARGETLGTTYLRPVWVDNPRPARGDEALWARFGDRIVLRDDVQVEAQGSTLGCST